MPRISFEPITRKRFNKSWKHFNKKYRFAKIMSQKIAEEYGNDYDPENSI